MKRSSKPLKLLLADDHTMVRQGLRSLLAARSHWNICAEATNGSDAVDIAREHLPDIIIMDIQMPIMNGIEATRRIRKDHPAIEVLILTMCDIEPILSEVFEAGARGCILKSDTASLLLEAVETIAERKMYIPESVSDLAKVHVRDKKANNLALELTPREIEVVQLIVKGALSKEIAEKMGLSIKTVDTHRASVMRKLQLHTTKDLIRYAIRNHIAR